MYSAAPHPGPPAPGAASFGTNGQNGTATMGRPLGKRVRITELVVLFSVCGIFVSIAAPSYVSFQRRAHIHQLLASARTCRSELSRWIETSVNVPEVEVRAEPSAARPGTDTGDQRTGLLEAFARAFNEKHAPRVSGLSGKHLLVLEPSRTLPASCDKDGRIHVIPVPDPAGRTVGARLVVTDDRHSADPGHEGVLAIYEVQATRDIPYTAD